MNSFSANVILAGVWVLLMGTLDLFTIASGLILGFFVLALIQPLTGGTTSYFWRGWYWIKLIVLFHYELLASSIEVLWDIVTPRHRARPGIVDVPLLVRSDAGILLVTNLISLTPGTLSLDISPDRSTLTVHAMFADDPEAIRASIRDGMEKWVRDAIE